MPIYTYKCSRCSDIYEPFLDSESSTKQSLDAGYVACHDICCGGHYRRRFSFANHADTFGEFYDHSSGQHVTSMRQYRDINKVASEAATRRTGVEHNFQPVDLMDVKPPEVP